MQQANAIKPTADTNATRSQNVGNKVVLSGSRPDGTGTLFRVDDDSSSQVPWLASIKSVLGPGQSFTTLGPIIKGQFGVGGITHDFEADAKPDSILTLPGTTAYVNTVWDQAFIFTDNGANPDTVQRVREFGGHSLLPESAIVQGGVKHGSPVTPNATRTFVFRTQGGANHAMLFDCPAFSNTVTLYAANDAAYANFTLEFLAANGIAGSIITHFTGAQLLAFKNAGQPIPIPGGAIQVLLSSNANVAGNLMFGLNL